MKILRGKSDANIKFDELLHLMRKLDFEERIKGSHHIFYKEEILEILNLQGKNRMAKPYQIKQVRNIIIDNRLDINKDE